MVMNARKEISSNLRMPAITAVQQLDATKELIRSTKEEDFITVLNFMDIAQAFAFVDCINKCRRHNLKDREKKYWLKAKALVAIKGGRADKYSMTLALLLVPEAYGGHSANGDKHRDNDHGNSNY